MRMRETTIVAAGIAALLLVFGIIASLVTEGTTSGFDRSIMLAFRNTADASVPIGPPWMQEAARDLTALGSYAVVGIMIAAILGYLFLDGKYVTGWLMLAAVLSGVTMNNLLKYLFARPRPDFIEPAAKVFTASFPSGHAAGSAIAYLTIAALLTRTTLSRRLRIYFVSVGIALTLLVGVSRLYLGVHYPTDVLAGWCIGTAWALGCWAIMTRLQLEGQVEPPERP